MTDPISEPMEARIDAFAIALEEICRRHGVMIWTETETMPIMATVVLDDDEFHYEVVKLGIRTAMIRRVLTRRSSQESE